MGHQANNSDLWESKEVLWATWPPQVTVRNFQAPAQECQVQPDPKSRPELTQKLRIWAYSGGCSPTEHSTAERKCRRLEEGHPQASSWAPICTLRKEMTRGEKHPRGLDEAISKATAEGGTASVPTSVHGKPHKAQLENTEWLSQEGEGSQPSNKYSNEST